MNITTFAKLITSPLSKKIYLAEIEPSQYIINWTLHAGSVYYTDIEVVDILSFEEDGAELTEVDSLAEVSAGKWFHGKNKIYLQATSGTPFSNVMVANYKLYFATEYITLNGKFYEGLLDNVPIIDQQKTEVYFGVSVISSGTVSFLNDNGFFDTIYKSYSWNNKNITIFLGGEDLPYSEYSSQFGGIITDKLYSTAMFKLEFEDRKNGLVDRIPKNTFETSVYPNLDSEDEGKTIPLIYGTVIKVPTICTTRGAGTSTGLHSFKILDTSLCTVNEISQVYVEDVAVSHQSGSISDASFKLASGTYSPGDSVTVSIIATEDNPVEQIKNIASNVLSIPYNSDNYDTATVAIASENAEEFPCGLAITEARPFLDIIGDLMQSCMGTFFNGNNGKYSIIIWEAEVGSDLKNIDYNDIQEGTFDSHAMLDEIRKTVRIGWKKNWGANSYSYRQLSSDTTEKVYGIKKSKTVTTLLSTSNGVSVLLGRLGMIFETETLRITFDSNLQLADKNIGDRIRISFKRQEEDSNIAWADSLAVEINSIFKDFENNKISIALDDLKGVGDSVGHWTSDAPVFPDYLGGGSLAAWDSSWSSSQKDYAKANAGFWTNDDGFADPDDPSSLRISRWW